MEVLTKQVSKNKRTYAHSVRKHLLESAIQYSKAIHYICAAVCCLEALCALNHCCGVHVHVCNVIKLLLLLVLLLSACLSV
jgi:hypothetical protein